VVGTGEASPVRLAIEGDADAALRIAVGGTRRGEAIREGDGEGEGIEFAEEALQGGLMRRDAAWEAKGSKESGGLPLAPLSNREDRKMVGEQGDDCQGEHRREGKAATVGTARIGKGRERFDQSVKGDRLKPRGCIATCRVHRLHGTLLCH